ncbi:MAG: reprolysin-like metallopeptidase [Ferruginibacter sp.]
MMRKIYKTLLVLITLIAGLQASAQKYWSFHNELQTITATDKAVARQSFPKEFKLFDLDIVPLRQQLFSVAGNRNGHSTIIDIPNAKGNMEQFEVFEASNFEPDLQARFPEIRAYSGQGVTDRSATLKLSISPQGIQTMIFRTETSNEFIEAYSQDHSVYAVFISNRQKGNLPWTCSTEDKTTYDGLNNKIAQTNNPVSNTGELKTMRLAQSCNGEYANFFGATSATQVGLVLAAMNATLTRANGCYERDLALHLNLISQTTDIIYYDPATDPYTTLGSWNLQLQTVCTTIIGEANYDIGHMFGASGGGGNAGCIGCVCVSPNINGNGNPTNNGKGSGITSPADGIPMGDNFDIDYVVHEVGHQLGGNHTFSMSLENGGVNNVEVGSGITIMGYAGITSQDVARHSIDIFHERTIQQIQNNLATKSCPVTTNISANNATPVVAAVSDYTIPSSTPFALTGSATDANPGDVLTYCWEQNDAANSTVSGNNSVAFSAKLVGPNWLSFPATVSPIRLMPKLSTILAGLFITPVIPGGDAIANIEALSSVSRNLNFRLTVKDNSAYSSTAPVKVGQTALTNMVVTVTNTSGPFKISSPNTAVSWDGGSTKTITWDVANSTMAPVSCANVKISLSIDGGISFPTVIAANTANDGTETITVPSLPSSTCRIKIEAIGNIFFDINDANFTIVQALPTFSFTTPAPNSTTCGSTTSSVTLQTSSLVGFVTPINLVATGNPAGTTVGFSVNPLVPGNSTVVTLNNTGSLTPGSYTITVTGTAGSEVKTVQLTYTVSAGAGPAITTQPASQSVCTGGTTSFSIASPTATSLQWQVSSTGAAGPWTNVTNGSGYSGATTATLTLTGITVLMNNYQYRAVASVQCGSTISNPAVLTVNSAPLIILEDGNKTVCQAQTVSFAVSAEGAGLTYQWQVSLGGCGGPWVNLANTAPYSGVTTGTLTINPVAVSMNGYGYRCIVTGTCSPAATSTCKVLTVNTAVTITTQPAGVTVCAGGNASFTVGASGTTPSYQWQLSTDGGTSWMDIAIGGVYSGATTVTLTLTNVTVAMNDYLYRAVVSGASPCGTVNSASAALTVNTAAAISAQPVATTVLCVGNNVTYTIAASGTALIYQWQVSMNGGTSWANLVNGGVYSGVSTASLTITSATAAMSAYQYRVVVSGTCAPIATSTATILTVNTPVTFTTQPADAVICATGTTSFTAVAAGTIATNPYQWQESANGGTSWVNVSNGGVYAGANTTTLTLSGVTTAMNNNQYRLAVTGTAPCGVVTSTAATLTVSARPTLNLTVSPFTKLQPGLTTTITANVTPTTGYLLNWTYNGNPLAVNGNAYMVDVNHLGLYTVQATIGSCISEVASVTIGDSASTRLFIYPSPNDGRFTVSYYSPSASVTSTTTQTITIYDRFGRRVWNNKYLVSQPYQLHKIDMRRNSAGIYYIILTEANGNTIGTGEVVVF